MKKKLLAALLVLVMLLSVMPLAAYAEDEDSGEVNGEVLEEVQENSETPKESPAESQAAETPASETPSNDVLNVGTPAVTDEDDVKGDDESVDPVKEEDTPEEVVAEPAVVSEDEEEDPAAEENTPILGAEAGTNKSTDTYCSVTDDHMHVWYPVNDNGDGKHTKTCSYCEHVVTEDHTMYTDGAGNSYCTLCHSGCAHSERKATASSALTHYFVCAICGEYMGYESHTFVNGVCTVCGEEECTHEHTSWWYTQYGHVHQCGDCGQNVDEWEDHTMVDGKCTVCGYNPCPDGEHVYNREASGSDAHFCTKCNYVSACIDEDPIDCVCDICGNTRHGLNGYTVEHDENECWYVCTRCKEVYYKGEHFDDWNNETGAEGSDGLCDVCGYAMSGSGSSSDDSGLDDVPKTGDASLALAGLSVLFAACPILKKFVI